MPTAIIQARMSSSRLPGKVLLDIAGQPMLVHMVERARRALSVEQVIVATTTDPSDDPIERLCTERGYACYRGSLPDVLDRYTQAARQYRAQTIVRLTADCPLLDPGVLDLTVQALAGHDFAANRLPPPWTRSLPIGLDVEVVTYAALERAWLEARERNHREHVLPYLYEGVVFDPQPTPAGVEGFYTLHGNSPRGFKIAQLHHSPDYGALRWTVDTPADLELVRQVVAHLGEQPGFTWLDVLAVFERHPELAEINAQVVHKTAFDTDHRL
jgi:spore coat polysaccharide biosynthesis protein SpsF